MKLTFLENQFVLQNVDKWTESNPAFKKSWIRYIHTDAPYYGSNKLSEAVRFRSVADEKAERIFKNFMLKRLPIPSHGLIVPNHRTLFEFQSERGVPHILSHSKNYLAHEPGLGKSAQFITSVNTKPGRAVVICPSFLKTMWAREITDWYHLDFPVIEIVPDSENQSKCNFAADFIICSDSMIEKEWVRKGLASFNVRHVAVDEAHRFKTPNANRTVALFGGRNKKIKSRGMIYESEHVTLMSGTPLLNRPIELWPILYGIAPQLINFMLYRDFGFHFGDAVQDERGHWRFTGSSNEEELHQKVIGSGFMQYIKKTDVLKDLPPKIRQVLTVDQDSRALEIKELDSELRKRFKKTKVDEAESLGEYAKLRHLNGLAKIDWVSGVVSAILNYDKDERILLFAYHRDVVAMLAHALRAHSPMVINGGVTDEERTAIEDLFQSGKRNLIIGNIDAMNLGLTLTKATRVMFGEYSWTNALNTQAEDRAHRIGQENSIFAQYFVLPNSFDEVMLSRVWDKQEKIERIIR